MPSVLKRRQPDARVRHAGRPEAVAHHAELQAAAPGVFGRGQQHGVGQGGLAALEVDGGHARRGRLVDGRLELGQGHAAGRLR